MDSVTRYVEGKLKLKVNREKSAVDRPWNRKFLGFSFLSNRKATIRSPTNHLTIQREGARADEPNTLHVDGKPYSAVEPISHWLD